MPGFPDVAMKDADSSMYRERETSLGLIFGSGPDNGERIVPTLTVRKYYG